MNDFQEGVHVSMENVILSGRDAVSFLTSSLVKQLDADNEFAAYISRSSNNFMAYLSGSMDFTPLLCFVEGRPRMSRQEGARLAQMLSVSLPLHIMVSSASCRRNSKSMRCSVQPGGIPGDLCFKVADGFYCILPELALLQLARECTDIQIVVLMSMLFGIFAKDRETGSLVPRRSVTTPAKVAAFIESCEQSCLKVPNGLSRVKKLVPLAVCGAASPKEIECALRLGYPVELGGCGLGIPEMNYRLDIPSTMRARYCDLYWPEQNVAVEYHGAFEHALPGSLEADALHGNDLASIGVPIFNITASQLRNLSSFNQVARLVEKQIFAYKKPHAHKCNKVLFPSTVVFHDKQQALRDQIDAAFALFGF